MKKNNYSIYKIAWFTDKLMSFITNKVTAPICIRIKPTNRCCHNCYFCVYNSKFSAMHETTKRSDEIPIEKMLEILNNIADIGVKTVTLSGGGEPLVHPNIDKILDKILSRKLGLSMLTNGQKITDTISDYLVNADWIRISMDYYSPQSFLSSGRGTVHSYNELCTNVKNFVLKNKNCEIGVNFVITKDNYSHLEDSIKFIIDLGIHNVRYAPVWITNFYEYHSLIQKEVLEGLSKIRTLYGDKIDIYDSYNISGITNKRTYSKCYFQQVVPVIGADLNVYSCHNKAYSKDGVIGSIKDRSFSDLWFSNKVREHFNTFNPVEHCNHQCANDKKNIFLHELIDCYGDNYV